MVFRHAVRGLELSYAASGVVGPARACSRVSSASDQPAETRFEGRVAVRFLQFLIFLTFLSVVGIFAVQNTDVLTFRFLNWSVTGPVALLAIVTYLVGMLSGWTVVSFAMRSMRRIGQHS
jgi:uncharacterized integral membrane protein